MKGKKKKKIKELLVKLMLTVLDEGWYLAWYRIEIDKENWSPKARAKYLHGTGINHDKAEKIHKQIINLIES